MLHDRLTQLNIDLANACRKHLFVRRLADGSLAREAFGRYIAQDAFFLRAFLRACAMAAARGQDRPTHDSSPSSGHSHDAALRVGFRDPRRTKSTLSGADPMSTGVTRSGRGIRSRRRSAVSHGARRMRRRFGRELGPEEWMHEGTSNPLQGSRVPWRDALCKGDRHRHVKSASTLTKIV